jgi:hypothetical protein
MMDRIPTSEVTWQFRLSPDEFDVVTTFVRLVATGAIEAPVDTRITAAIYVLDKSSVDWPDRSARLNLEEAIFGKAGE